MRCGPDAPAGEPDGGRSGDGRSAGAGDGETPAGRARARPRRAAAAAAASPTDRRGGCPTLASAEERLGSKRFDALEPGELAQLTS